MLLFGKREERMETHTCTFVNEDYLFIGDRGSF